MRNQHIAYRATDGGAMFKLKINKGKGLLATDIKPSIASELSVIGETKMQQIRHGKRTGMKIRYAVVFAFCVLLCFVGPLYADEPSAYPDPPDYPVEPTREECFVRIVTDRFSRIERFTMDVDFCETPKHGPGIRVGVAFVRQVDKTKGIVYKGRIDSQASRDNLKSLAGVNHLHYWDNVFLVNYSGGKPLRIDSIEVRIRSANGRLSPWSSITIAADPRNAHSLLTATSRLKLDTEKCRIQFFKRYLPRNYKWNKIPPSARSLMLDLGKFGTNASDSRYPSNPKLGYPAGCSETISWYDYEFGEPKKFYVKFKDITCWWQMSAIFDEQDRLYSWNKKTERFEHTSEHDLLFIAPKPGDDFFWDDSLPGGDGIANGDVSGHVMKIVSTWRGNGASKHFLYMDGSYPIRVKKFYARTMSIETTMGYCIGRVPEND